MSTAEVADQTIPSNTFLVSAEVKDSSHLYYGIGSELGLVVNGVQGKELVLVRGQTYTFKVDTGVKHDFYLSTSPKGWGAATLTDGVKGNYTYLGVVTFSPNENTPDVVYYACRNHKNMGSKIHVVNKGDEGKVVFGVRDEATPASKPAAEKSAFTSGNQAKQKVMFAEMFIASSPAAKRIDASGHDEAKQLLGEARAKLANAKKALAAGKDAQAISIVDDALRSMSAASQLVPSEAKLSELRAQFDELLKGAHTYEKSYRRNLKLMQKKGKKKLPDLDIDQISKMIVDAEKLADNNQFEEANNQLSKVQRSITGALTELLADETMDYTLTFDNPKEEYEYELSRYKSYEELVPIAIEQKNPQKQTRALMEQFVEKAKSTYALSGPKAKEGDYKTAIQMLQGATSHMQRALRIVGVR
jgi:flagellin-specific chaperone FliS